MIEIDERQYGPTVIKVVGIGGGGGNVIERMIDEGIQALEYIAINTDAQVLYRSRAHTKVQIGVNLTKGLGAGANPEIGAKAAEENIEDIKEALRGANMAFITAGMGGGTGTGASTVIAKLLKEMDILTVAVVTKPFEFEGPKRMAVALQGIKELERHVDTLIVVPNENLVKTFGENATVLECFQKADEVLLNGVRSITELITLPGIINVDFADVRTVMRNKGPSVMGTVSTKVTKGSFIPQELAQRVVANPILDTFSIGGAKGILINVKHGKNIPLSYITQINQTISEEAAADCDIITGIVLDEENDDNISVTLIATGIDADRQAGKIFSTSPRESLGESSSPTPSLSSASSSSYEPSSSGSFSPSSGIPSFIRPPSAQVKTPERETFENSLGAPESPVDRKIPREDDLVVTKAFFDKSEYVDTQNIEIPTFLRKRKQ